MFTFSERPLSGATRTHPPSYTALYVAAGTTDRAYVRSYALMATPNLVATTMGTLWREDVIIDPQAPHIFYITIPYGERKWEYGQYNLSFDTTGGTLHIRNSKETRQPTGSTGTNVGYPINTAPNFHQLIGVNGENVEGCEVVIPVLKITTSLRHPMGLITPSLIKQLANVTGYVSTTTFLGFAPGETLFLGAQGKAGSDTETEITYHFAMSANADGITAPKLTIGDIANIVKRGHDIVWIRYKDNTETIGGVTYPIKEPQFVYVERVYDETDLVTALGFGG